MGDMVFGPGALIAVGLYLVSMIGVGWIARTRRRANSMADFYLAGRSMGLLVLFLTLYATQYSGNTLFGYTGKTYRIGFEWTASVLFMFSVIVGYLLFAPRLVALARKEGFITPGDYITHRFRSAGLTLLSTLLMIYALGNYALAQLKAMGAARGTAERDRRLRFRVPVGRMVDPAAQSVDGAKVGCALGVLSRKFSHPVTPTAQPA